MPKKSWRNSNDEVVKLRDEREKAQSIANTSGSLLTAEKAAQDKLAAQVKLLENENRVSARRFGVF